MKGDMKADTDNMTGIAEENSWEESWGENGRLQGYFI